MRFLFALAALFVAFALHTVASASVLTFDISDPNPLYSGTENFPEGYNVDQQYGDRVTSTTMPVGTSQFEYAVGAEGFTPNITVNYGPYSIFTQGPQLWRYNYGDLERVLYQGSEFPDPANPIGFDYDYLAIEFTADPGYEVVLYGFDLGGWFETDYEINEVAVYDAPLNLFFPNDNKVYSDPGATVLGAGPTHSTYSFGTPLRGNIVTIFLDMNNLGDTSVNIGIDNIVFGQQLDADGVVPEPLSLLVWAGVLTLGGGVAFRSRTKMAS